MERVSTVGYHVIKQCLIGFITEGGESRCSVCAVTMPNCSGDKGLKAILIRGVSEAHQAGEACKGVTMPINIFIV